ncbi:MAG TPA: T9SS type A sorting domain-containing protein [Flavobacteriales bacterium]|nr:T9SS type A sorting domain-containing protein [Flavobacteriales bacterium]
MLRPIALVFSTLLTVLSFSQTVSERAAVRLTATVQTSSITLNWVSMPSTTSLTIYRKTKSATTWGSAVASPSASSLQWVDNTVSSGTYYEYKVVRVSAGVTGTGYISTGIQVPAVDYRGKVILLVDNTLSSPLAPELTQLIWDLRADGWTVLRSDVSRTASVTSIRSIVQAHYNSDPTNVKALYIVGHVPVPYSGNITPDGHDDGKGARPTDGYYADVNGTWTDATVNTQISTHTQAWNTPGDGKFDQSDFPSAIELQVGRVDLYDMPAFASTGNEVQLMRNYLNKAHSYKIKGWSPTVRGIVIDNLSWLSNPIAASGFRTAPLTGNANLQPAYPITEFYTYINNQSYLWTYHCGGGQQSTTDGVVTYSGTDGGATTAQLASSVTMGGVFNMALGSFFYDFDNKNNFLRAVIARGDGLTNCWAGIPAWYYHHMGMGDNIGYSVLQTMNNTGLYTPLTEGWQSSIGRTHLNLMGDPTLRMKMVAPPTNLSITNSGGHPVFAWTASTESVLGYYVYQIDPTTGVVTRLTTNPVTTTSYTGTTIPFVAGREYMVRAVKLETNFSGSYYNVSLGSIATSTGTAATDCLGIVGGTATVGSPCNDNNACTTGDVWNSSCQCVGTSISPTATITASGATSFCAGGSVVLNSSTGTGYTYAWKRDGVAISGATASTYTATLGGSYTVTIGSGGCSVTSAGVTVIIKPSPVSAITPGGATGFCTGGSVLLSGSTATGNTYVWKRNGTTITGATASSYTATLAGTYTLVVTNGGCSTTSSATTVTVGTAPAATITAGGSTTFCSGGSVVLSGNTGTGYTYVWKRGGTAISGATGSSYTASVAGSYTLTVSNGGCETTSAATTVTVTAGPTATITAGGATSFCTGGSVVLTSNTGTGYTYVWKRGGTTISGATSSSYTASVAGSYTVTISSGSCSSTSLAATVVVNALPTASITAGGATAFCSGSNVVLNANTGTGHTYVWRRDGIAIGGAVSSSYTASAGGSYTVVVSNGGCSQTSAATVVTVYAGPTVSCTSNATNATVSVAASGGLAPYTYSWNTSPVQTTATASVINSGSYLVNVTDARGCRSSCTSTITITGGGTCTGTRTESQTTWGATASGSNPAAYMTSNFAAAFPAPNYLTIGCGSRTLSLTSAAAVTAFLPSTGTVARLPYGAMQNPGSTYSNMLAGQLIALKLSVRFDELSATFSSSNVLLKNMVIASGPFAGWTVQQLIAAADSKIGGCGGSYSRTTLNTAITAVNDGYLGGTMNSGFLICPGSSALALQPEEAEETFTGIPTPKEEQLEVSIFPNPVRGTATILISGTAQDRPTTVEIHSMSGALMKQLYSGTLADGIQHRVTWNAEGRATGMYFYRVVSGDRTTTGKIVVE